MLPDQPVAGSQALGYLCSSRTTRSWETWRPEFQGDFIPESPKTITRLLRDWKEGDEQAFGQLVPLVYEKLRGLARLELKGERAGHSLQPTDLVHDAYGRMVDLELSWQDRVHFYRMAARTMRRVLVDHARARRAEKRGGDAVVVSLTDVRGQPEQPASDVLDLNQALERLGEQEERLSQAIELYYFGGLTHREIAHALGVSEATVDRDLRFARAWLRRELEPPAPSATATGPTSRDEG